VYLTARGTTMPKYSIAFDLHEGNNAQSNYDDAFEIIKKQANTELSIGKALRSHYVIKSQTGIGPLGKDIFDKFKNKGIHAFDMYITSKDGGEYYVKNGVVSTPPLFR
jgi:hypothetical protein